MKSIPCTIVRWVQPVMLGGMLAEPTTRADAITKLSAQDFGVMVTREKLRVLVPWSNVKQADAE